MDLDEMADLNASVQAKPLERLTAILFLFYGRCQTLYGKSEAENTLQKSKLILPAEREINQNLMRISLDKSAENALY